LEAKLEEPFSKKEHLKVSFPISPCYKRCNYEEVMANLPRQRIVEGDLVVVTLRGDSK
jgi:hypothetical protein